MKSDSLDKHLDKNADKAVALAQALIRCRSVTPEDDGALDIVEAFLKPLGFVCHRLVFGAVDNIYARLGTGAPFLCFAGHTDVVPPGDLAGWDHPPFAADIADGRLYGRGASDMKGAVAAFLIAAENYLKNKDAPPKGSIGLLITGDEEAEAIDGTKKILAWMAETGEKIDDCLIGEPSNFSQMGEAIKIGRRGSFNMDLTLYGQQGHAANPHLAANPLPVMAQILTALNDHILDDGVKNFMPSNLEITSIDTGNAARNVIPSSCRAQFNVRYNHAQTKESLERIVRKIIDGVIARHETIHEKIREKIRYDLHCQNNGDPFLTAPCAFSDLVRDVVHQITGRMPEMATNGGTSDARYIKDYARTVEFGLTTATIHKANEWAAIDDIKQLARIYEAIITNYFGG